MKQQAPDDVAAHNRIMHAAYEKMHQALLKTGRPIVYSLCQYGWDSVWQWAPQVGANLWRTTGDIQPNFDRMSLIGLGQAGLAKYAGPGHWNDPDMLEVGNGKLTLDENRVHMGLWAMLAAPLLAGNNLSRLTPEITAILTNRDVIAIDQDPLGREASRIYAEGPIEIWARPLSGGAVAMDIINFNDNDSFLRGITLHLKEAGAAPGWKARDLWAGTDLGPVQDDHNFVLKGHSSMLLRLTP